jgi:hypothetical protein
MKFLFAFLLISITQLSMAQLSFSVSYNGKIVVKKQKQNDTKATQANCKIGQKLAGNSITIAIDETSNDEMVREIIVMDENDSEVSRTKEKDSKGIYTIKIAFPADKKELTVKINTVSLPKDPNKAALVRVRMMRLAEIKFTK